MSFERVDGSRKIILIVEDDESIRSSLGQLLELEGYAVVLAEHGKHALDHLSSGLRPDLIVLDLMMPVMNGHEFLNCLRQDDELKRLPVLLLSAVPKSAEASCVQVVLRKPIDVDVLLRHIMNLTTVNE